MGHGRSRSSVHEHFAGRWDDRVTRARRRRHGEANYRLIRYADDFVVMVSGTGAPAEDLRDEVATVIAPMGLRLSEKKTRVAHIDEGLDFLGWRIQRHQKRGGTKSFVSYAGDRMPPWGSSEATPPRGRWA